MLPHGNIERCSSSIPGPYFRTVTLRFGLASFASRWLRSVLRIAVCKPGFIKAFAASLGLYRAGTIAVRTFHLVDLVAFVLLFLVARDKLRSTAIATKTAHQPSCSCAVTVGALDFVNLLAIVSFEFFYETKVSPL